MGKEARQVERRLQDKFEQNMKDTNSCLVGIKVKVASLSVTLDDLKASLSCITHIKDDLTTLKSEIKNLKSLSNKIQSTMFSVVGKIIQLATSFILGGIGGTFFTKFF